LGSPLYRTHHGHPHGSRQQVCSLCSCLGWSRGHHCNHRTHHSHHHGSRRQVCSLCFGQGWSRGQATVLTMVTLMGAVNWYVASALARVGLGVTTLLTIVTLMELSTGMQPLIRPGLVSGSPLYSPWSPSWEPLTGMQHLLWPWLVLGSPLYSPWSWLVF
jgi:hypothetical protein